MKRILLSILTVFLASAIYAQLDDQPLLLHLEFEDEDDIAYNDQDMTYDEAEPTVEFSTDAKIGEGAASFDGLQYIIMDVNDGALNCQSTNYTWAAWVKTDAPGGTLFSWSCWSGTPADGNGPLEDEDGAKDGHQAAVQALFWGFEPGAEGAPVFDVGWVDLFPSGDIVINDGAWHHVVLSNDIETPLQVIYIDGVAQANTGAIGVTDYDEAPETPVEEFVLKVGYSNSLWPADEAEANQWPYFTGVMDDFRMYGAALSADEVTELFEYAPTSIERAEASLDFEVYPNPASEQIQVKTIKVRNLEIFNTMGQLLRSEKDVQNGQVINISSLEAGLYFVKSGDSIQKLIVE